MVLALRGLLAILFGVVVLLAPGLTLMALLYTFGAFALLSGILSIIAGILGKVENRWWAIIVEGALGVIAGLIAFFMPGVTAMALLILIAAWCWSSASPRSSPPSACARKSATSGCWAWAEQSPSSLESCCSFPRPRHPRHAARAGRVRDHPRHREHRPVLPPAALSPRRSGRPGHHDAGRLMLESSEFQVLQFPVVLLAPQRVPAPAARYLGQQRIT